MALAPADARARLLHTFDVLAEWVKKPGFCGCTFINAALQLNDPGHPAHAAAVAEKASMRARLEQLARAPVSTNRKPWRASSRC